MCRYVSNVFVYKINVKKFYIGIVVNLYVFLLENLGYNYVDIIGRMYLFSIKFW